MTPEQKLWRAVIMKTYRDFDSVLGRIRRQRNAKRSPYPAVRDLEKLWHELNAEWFNDICDFAGLPKDKFVIAVRKLHMQYKCGDLMAGYQ